MRFWMQAWIDVLGAGDVDVVVEGRGADVVPVCGGKVDDGVHAAAGKGEGRRSRMSPRTQRSGWAAEGCRSKMVTWWPASRRSEAR